MPRGSPDRRIEIPIINPVVRQAPEKVIRNVPPNDQRQKSGGFLSLIFGAPNASPEQRYAGKVSEFCNITLLMYKAESLVLFACQMTFPWANLQNLLVRIRCVMPA